MAWRSHNHRAVVSHCVGEPRLATWFVSCTRSHGRGVQLSQNAAGGNQLPATIGDLSVRVCHGQQIRQHWEQRRSLVQVSRMLGWRYPFLSCYPFCLFFFFFVTSESERGNPKHVREMTCHAVCSNEVPQQLWHGRRKLRKINLSQYFVKALVGIYEFTGLQFVNIIHAYCMNHMKHKNLKADDHCLWKRLYTHTHIAKYKLYFIISLTQTSCDSCT